MHSYKYILHFFTDYCEASCPKRPCASLIACLPSPCWPRPPDLEKSPSTGLGRQKACPGSLGSREGGLQSPVKEHQEARQWHLRPRSRVGGHGSHPSSPPPAPVSSVSWGMANIYWLLTMYQTLLKVSVCRFVHFYTYLYIYKDVYVISV